MTKKSIREQLDIDMKEAEMVLGRELLGHETALYELAWVKGAQAQMEENAGNISGNIRDIPKH